MSLQIESRKLCTYLPHAPPIEDRYIVYDGVSCSIGISIRVCLALLFDALKSTIAPINSFVPL